MASYGEIIRNRREELGFTLAQVAEAVGLEWRTVQRWEKCERQIDFPDKVNALSRKLGLTLDEMAGNVPVGLQLTGDWYAWWRTRRNGVKLIDRHSLTASQSKSHLSMDASGDYLWRAEGNLVGEHFDGTYWSTESGREFHGTMNMWFGGPKPDMMIGHWSGSFFDAPMGSGWGVIARDPEAGEKMIHYLIDRGDEPILEWPELH